MYIFVNVHTPKHAYLMSYFTQFFVGRLRENKHSRIFQSSSLPCIKLTSCWSSHSVQNLRHAHGPLLNLHHDEIDEEASRRSPAFSTSSFGVPKRLSFRCVQFSAIGLEKSIRATISKYLRKKHPKGLDLWNLNALLDHNRSWHFDLPQGQGRLICSTPPFSCKGIVTPKKTLKRKTSGAAGPFRLTLGSTYWSTISPSFLAFYCSYHLQNYKNLHLQTYSSMARPPYQRGCEQYAPSCLRSSSSMVAVASRRWSFVESATEMCDYLHVSVHEAHETSWENASLTIYTYYSSTFHVFCGLFPSFSGVSFVFFGFFSFVFPCQVADDGDVHHLLHLLLHGDIHHFFHVEVVLTLLLHYLRHVHHLPERCESRRKECFWYADRFSKSGHEGGAL